MDSQLFMALQNTTKECVQNEEEFTFSHKEGIFYATSDTIVIQYNSILKEWKYDSNNSGIVGVGKNLIAASISHYKALAI